MGKYSKTNDTDTDDILLYLIQLEGFVEELFEIKEKIESANKEQKIILKAHLSQAVQAFEKVRAYVERMDY